MADLPTGRVSVIIPVLAQAPGLDRTLASLSQQVRSPDEILLVATEPEPQLWEQLLSLQREQASLAVVRQQRPGLVRALNAGLALVTGSYLTWLAPGCQLVPKAFSQMAAAVEAHPGVGLAFGQCPHLSRAGRPGGEAPDWAERLLEENPVGCAFLVRAQSTRALGGLRGDCPGLEAWDLWIRMSERFEILELPETLCLCGAHCAVTGAHTGASAMARALVAAHRARRAQDRPDPSGAAALAEVPASLHAGSGPSPQVLLLAPELSSAPSYAIGLHLQGLARALAGRGCQVHVLAPRVRVLGLQSIRGVRVHAPANRPPFAAPYPVADALQEQALMLGAGLEASDAAGRFDLIHAHSWAAASLAHSLHRTLTCPLVFTVHRLEGVDAEGAARPGRLYLREVLTWICEEAEQVICLSRFAAEQVRQAYRVARERMAVTPVAVDAGDWETDADTGAFRDLFGPPDTRIMTFAGRLEGEKGPQVLVEALPHIIAVAPQARLVIAGEGPLEPLLRQRLRELGLDQVVTFAGYLRGKVLATLLWSTDVFVIPSLMEMSGQAAAEAMLCGVPVVASGVGGALELVEHEGNGLLVPPGDARALAGAVVRLLYDRQLARALARQGQRRVVEEHLWKHAAEHVLRVYARVEPDFARV